MLVRVARSSTSTARQSTGAGGGLNFFTDDTPGLKLSPVSNMELVALDSKSHSLSTQRRLRQDSLSTAKIQHFTPRAIFEAPESVCSAQIVVVFMSLGFIGFVTVLHIIGKVSHARLLNSCRNNAAAHAWVRVPYLRVKEAWHRPHHDFTHL